MSSSDKPAPDYQASRSSARMTREWSYSQPHKICRKTCECGLQNKNLVQICHPHGCETVSLNFTHTPDPMGIGLLAH
jgi:hypothetical protein